MGTGYTRNDTSNNIADGNIINAADLDGEFDAIESAMGTSGHTHDGTSAEGGPVTVLGPVQDFVASATEIKPKTTNTLDIGTSGLLFKDMFLDGVATVGSIKIDNAGTIGSASDADAIAISSGGVVSFSQNTIGKTGSGYVLSLQTSDTTIEATNVLGKIEFSAPDEASGTDAILVGASIEALAEDTFDSSTNSTALVFKTNTTGAATERMRLTSAGDLHFLDNRKAIFGAGSDLWIYHDGTDSYIEERNGTGSLYIDATDLQLRSTANAKYFRGITGGAVDLYYDNASKLATTSTGISVTGNATFADNGKAIFGAGSDLQIYHNSANNKSYIEESGSGNLVIRGSDIDILAGNGEAAINVAQDGAVTLYYDNAEKLATTNTGVDITGTLTVNNFASLSSTTLTIGGEGGANGVINSDESIYLNIDSNNNETGKVFRVGTDSTSTGGKSIALFSDNGDISFYEDTGTTAKFFWSAADERLGIGTSSPATTLDITAGTSACNITQTRGSLVQIIGPSGFNASDAGQLGTTSNSPFRFITNGSPRMTIDASGNVGIGTSSPSYKLDVASTVQIRAGESLRLQNVAGSSAATIQCAGAGTNSDLGFSTAGSERMRINSSGNVGIGTTSPSGNLQVLTATSGTVANITHNTGGSYPKASGIGLGASSTSLSVSSDGGTVSFVGGAGMYAENTAASGNPTNLVFWTNAAGTPEERMRIDSSGNLLVGTTTVDSFTNVGHQLDADGYAIHTRTSAPALYVGRKTTDGSLLEFNKDGAPVGNIGTSGGDIGLTTSANARSVYIGGANSGGSGRYLNFDLDVQAGGSSSGNEGGAFFSSVDDVTDLGAASNRFHDLYLSGGVYLGGTGSANKLDDYEEGTFAPTVSTGTVATTTATYTKIGQLVTVRGLLHVFSDRTSTDYVEVTNLPFLTKSASNEGANGSIFGRYCGIQLSSTYILSNSNSCYFYNTNPTGNYEPLQYSDLSNSDAAIYFMVTYETSQ